MTKTQIFDDVVSIVKNDASFIKDEVGADAEIYRKQISDDMDDDAFLYMLESYLGTFHVLGHLSFRNMKRGRLPFRVKPYGDVLYVIETAENSPLNVGDKIIKVDGTPIKEYGEQHINYFCGEAEERRGSKWSSLLSYAKELTAVSADDSEKQISVTLDGQWAKEEKYFCKKLSDNITLMRLADFADDIAITKMYRDNDALLRESEYLIIDVRSNGGGNDSAFYPLWEFCLPEGKSTASLSESEFDSPNEYNYTERNCDSRIAIFEEFMKQELPIDTRNMLTKMLDELKENRGKGFVTFHEGEEELPYIGTALPKKVYIITDERCGSSGDAFVDNMRRSDKVTVVGRPTTGILDFSNCTWVDYDHFTLVYPTSRNLYLDKGVRMRGRGIAVDIPIPWTPEHLNRDIDLESVLKLIEQNEQ